MPVPYFHVVFTLPARIADIAYQNKAVIYDLLFKASSETMLTIAADPKHLGARACSPAASAPRTSRAPVNCSCRQSFPSMPSRQSAPMLPSPSRKRQISAPAAAAAWSSLRGSNQAQRHTTERARRRQRSGSTPHDPITANQRSLPDLFLLACRRPPQPSSHLSSQFANTCTQISSLNMHPGLGSTS